MASDLKHGTLAGGGTVAIAGEVEVKNDAGNPIPVTGDFTSDGLTNTQLRASAVPVDTELVAYTEDAATPGDPVGAVTLLRRRDTPVTNEVSAEGDWIAPQATNKGEQYVKHLDAIPVTDNGGNLSIDDGGNSITVDGTFYQATQPVSLAAAVHVIIDSSASLAVTGPLTDTQLRATAVPVSGNYIEDAASAADPQLFMLGARRRDAPATSEVSADADNIAVNASSKGELYARPILPSTGAMTTVAASASSVSLLASNVARRGATVFNDSTVILYVRLEAAAASTSNYSVQVAPGGYYEVPFGYTGEFRGIWPSATGNARVTEFS